MRAPTPFILNCDLLGGGLGNPVWLLLLRLLLKRGSFTAALNWLRSLRTGCGNDDVIVLL